MVFRVEISAEAELDSIAILKWLVAQHAGEAGLRWFLSMDRAIAFLSTFPERCPLAPEDSSLSLGIRQLFYGRHPHVYRILFTIKDDTVYILHIRHGRRERLDELQ